MAFVAKQNVSFQELMDWSSTNPNKSILITPIEIVSEASLMRTRDSTEQIDFTLDSIRLPEYESITLNPAGMLSTIAFMSDSVYAYAPVRARNMSLRELATKLQEETDSLAGSSLARKRRKIHDGIGSLANSAAVKPEEWIDLFSSLAIMRNLQLIFVQMGNEDTAKAIYFSSDPAKWIAKKKIWVVDYNGRWIASPKTDESFCTLYEWIEDLEIYGWTVHWHIDSTLKKEDLVTILSAQKTWQKEHEKLKKDILAIRLAKQNTVNTLYTIAKDITKTSV